MRRFTVAVVALALIAAGLPADAQQRNLTWTAGQVGGGWYAQAGGFVELIKGKDASFNIKVIPGAGIQNMTKLQQGETEIAWGLPPFIAASFNGQDPYKDRHGDMRLLMNGLGFVHIQFCVPADYPAKSIREIFDSKKPITIGTTPPGGSDEWVMRKVFEFYKTTYADVRGRGGKVVLVSYSDLANQYRDRNMDILFATWPSPAPPSRRPRSPAR